MKSLIRYLHITLSFLTGNIPDQESHEIPAGVYPVFYCRAGMTDFVIQSIKYVNSG